MSSGIDKLTEGKVYKRIIIVASITFVLLPFITSFNEFLTKIVESLSFFAFIQGLVAPFIVRVIAVILRALRVPVSFDGSFLYLTGGWIPLRIYVNWNCVGWQSFILLAFTLVTGLQGHYTRSSRFLTILIGLEGTFLVNVVRIIVPTIIAYNFGYVPAIVFHDYMGTVFTLLWMGVFWNYAFQSVLVTTEGFGAYDGPSTQVYKSGVSKGDKQLEPSFKRGDT